MSSHNTKRHFRLRKVSHFCWRNARQQKLDWAALGWALVLRAESNSITKREHLKSQIFGSNTPQPALSPNSAGTQALLYLMPVLILNAEEGKLLLQK